MFGLCAPFLKNLPTPDAEPRAAEIGLVVIEFRNSEVGTPSLSKEFLD